MFIVFLFSKLISLLKSLFCFLKIQDKITHLWDDKHLLIALFMFIFSFITMEVSLSHQKSNYVQQQAFL